MSNEEKDTVHNWLSKIPVKETREAALRNCCLSEVDRQCLRSEALSFAFNWGDMAEGFRFWDIVDDVFRSDAWLCPDIWPTYPKVHNGVGEGDVGLPNGDDVTVTDGVCGDINLSPPQDEIQTILTERGSRYGSPLAHFNCTQAMYEVWLNKRQADGVVLENSEQERAIRHSVYMILDKCSRIAKDPTHIDNWDDIQGYSRCAKECLPK